MAGPDLSAWAGPVEGEAPDLAAWADPNAQFVGPRRRTLGERFGDNAEDAFRRGTLFGAGAEAMAAGVLGEAERERNREAAEIFQIRSQADPFYKAGGPMDVLTAGAATLGGQFAGTLSSPESLVGAGRTALTQALSNAGINAALDVPTQGLSNLSGAQEGYDPARTAGSAVLGFAVPYATEGAKTLAMAGGSMVDAASRYAGRKIAEGLDALEAAVASRPAREGPTIRPEQFDRPDLSEFARTPEEARPTEPRTARTAPDLSAFGESPEVASARQAAQFDDLWGRLTQQESGGRQFGDDGEPLTSSKGAFGVAQLMPDTAEYVAKKLGDPSLAARARTEAAVNEQLGRAYLQEQLDEFGDPLLAVAAYNAGPSRVREWIGRNGLPEEIGRGEWVKRIPFDETRDYVTKILGVDGGDGAPVPGLAMPGARPVRELPPDPMGPLEPLTPQGGQRSRGDLWRASPDELRDMLAEAELSAKDKLSKALGSIEAAIEFERLDRARNSSDPARADTASAEFDRRFGNLTPEQERLVYGVGETDAQADEIRAVLGAFGDAGRMDTDEWLGYMAAASARRLSAEDLRAVPEGRGTAEAQAAFVRMRQVQDALQARGIEPARAPQMMADALVSRGGWRREQAEEVVSAFARDLVGAADRQTPAALALAVRPESFAGERFAVAPGRDGRPAPANAPDAGRMGAIDLSAYGEPPQQASKNAGGLRAAPRPGDVPMQDGAAPFRGQTISQLAQRLRQSLGITHRQGRLTLKGGAVGEYDPGSAVIRTKAVQELDVLAHEATHALEFRGGSAIKAALQAHDAELRKLAYPGANPAHTREEGFAEFGRWYLTNPEQARRMAPNFYDDFERAFAADNPRAAAEFKAIQDAYQAFLAAPSLETAAASVALTGNRGPVDRIKEALRDRGVGGTLKDLADDAYTAFVDDLNPINKAVRRLQEIYAENTGQSLELNTAKNPYALARLSRESYAAGYVDLMEGIVPYRGVDPAGPSLSQALEHALGARTFGKWSEDELRQFDAYLIARRMIHEYDRWAAGELPNPPDRNSKEYHLGVIRDAEARHPTWNEAAAMLYEWNENLWRKEFNAGLITREAYENGLAKHPDYVPLMRDVSDKRPGGGAGRPRGAMQFAGGVKAFEGSTRDVISPTSSMMRRAYELNAIIKRNDAIRALDDLAQTAGPGSGAIVERLPAQEIDAVNVDAIDALTKAAEAAGLSERDVTTLVQAADAALDGEAAATVFRTREFSPRKGEAVVFAWRNGKKQPLLLADGRFGQDLYTALTGMNRDLQNVVVDVMAAGSQLLRYGVTLSPEFMSRNFVRDQLATWINTDVGFVPVVDALRGAASELSQDRQAIRYAIAGGMRGGANVAATRKPFPRSDAEAMAQLRTLQQKGLKVKRFASWRGLAEATDLSETSTRLGVFRRAFDQAKRRGLDDFDAVTEAAFASRDYLDFGRRGAKMLSAVRLVTFLNASLQSLDKTVRVLTADGNLHKVLAPLAGNPPKTEAERRALAHAHKAWAKVAALGALGLGLRMIYADDPEYQEISDTLRATHWVAKIEGRWVFIPKPFELATLSNILERAYEAGALKDPTAPQRLVSDFSHTIAPPHEIPAVSVPFAIAANRDYQGRPIVPDHLRGTVEPHLQFNSYTSEFSKKLGKALGVSPAVIDYVITGFGGSLGRYFQQGTNMAGEAVTGAEPMATGPQDMFLSRGFIRHVARGSNSQKQFWALVSQSGGELTRAEGTFRAHMKAGEDAKAADYLNGLPSSARSYVMAKTFAPGGTSSLHPLVRAQNAVSVIGDLRQANRENTLLTLKGEQLALSPQQRREVDDALSDLAMVEMRNALVETGVRGWGNKELMSRERVALRIKRASPSLAADLQARSILSRGTATEGSEAAWRAMRSAYEAEQDPQSLSRMMTLKRLTSPDRSARLAEVTRLRERGAVRVQQPAEDLSAWAQ